MRIAKAVVATDADRDLMAMLLKIRKGDVLDAGGLVARAGEHIAIFDLRAFGDERADWLAGLRAVTKRKAFVVQIDRASGEQGIVCGDSKGADLLDYTLDREKRDKHMPQEKSERLAEAKRQARRDRTMPERQACVPWFNQRLLTHEALGLMPGWKQPTAYRVFGKRSTPKGKELFIAKLNAREAKAAAKSKAAAKRKK